MRRREQRSRAAIWASFIRSPPARPWMGRGFVSSPGPRAVCFSCLYCHNPDTWSMKNGMPVTIERATEELRKYRSGLKMMSGGFTISGGEPLMQHRFVAETVQGCAEMGIHTALDTNGYLGDRLTDEDLDAISLVLLDIKTWDPERHRHLTGMEVAPVLAFARRLAARNRPHMAALRAGAGIDR